MGDLLNPMGELAEEPEQDMSPAPDVNEKAQKGDGKKLFFTILAVIGIFAFFFIAFKGWNGITGAAPITIDDFHTENLEGNLEEEQGYIYNGFSFVNVDNLWWSEVNLPDKRFKFPLHFGPKDVDQIPVTGNLDPAFSQGQLVYIAIDPIKSNQYQALAASELSINMAQGMNRIPEAVCTFEDSICDNRTIANCEDTKGMPLIEIVDGDGPRIEANGMCIKLIGKELDIVKAADRIILNWYGIIDVK
ncbi:TPA: hypothetical protein HA278_04410 [Candidatus Woesearchaeota archaeon]|nr:hypothetical protein [archaeon]HIJ11274.1 hypothetical protein [Candidatus Woesearchaeota archaeon]|tara:strand:- start:225 stop:965 length:741 start_codon:yes stop_codon:yes gene_type:complete